MMLKRRRESSAHHGLTPRESAFRLPVTPNIIWDKRRA
jgi:hypothetical protein